MTTWLRAVRSPVVGIVLAAVVTCGVATVRANAEPTTINGRIAFAGFDPLWRDNQIGQVFTLEPDGTGLTQVTTETGQGVQGVQWTRDGRTLVMPAYSRGMLATTQDGRDRRWLSRSRQGGATPDDVALSPDGTTFLAGGYSSLVAYDLDLTRPRAIALQGVSGTVRSPQWSADGTRVTFVVGESAPFSVWVADADGTDARRLSSGSYFSAPEFSPDGSKIVYVGESGEVRVIAVDGTDDAAIGPAGSSGEPTFSPDGSMIAFRHFTDDAAQLWIVGVDGSGAHAIAAHYAREIDWQPLGMPEEAPPWPTTTSTAVPTTTTTTTTSTTVVTRDDNREPSAVIGVTKGANARTVGVGAEKSRDPDGSIAAYEWRWGDATPPSPGRFAAHTYASPGIYTVELAVTDNQGAVSTSRLRIRVR